MCAAIGKALNRIDGAAKVTGEARYAADHVVSGMLYGSVVSSTIARGRIVSIDTRAALELPGVVLVITHENRPRPTNTLQQPLVDDRVRFSGEPVALVLAESLEAARCGSALVRIAYAPEAHNTDLRRALPHRRKPDDEDLPTWGDASRGFELAPLRLQAEFHLPPEHHNPIEMHATTAMWAADGRLTVYDKTQGSQRVRDCLASRFGFEKADLRVLNPFVGGAFGSGLTPQYQVYLAVLAALMTKRGVRVAMTREQMFTHVHRPECLQSIALGSEKDGTLKSMSVSATTATSRYGDHTESVVNWAGTAYACENANFDYAIASLDIPTPGDMRAPGAATGMNLFEIAMDELACLSDMDPLELRMRNYSDMDAMSGKPFSSKALMSAYREGAARFGWQLRTHRPGSMKDGSELIGWGMATGIWETFTMDTAARVRIGAGGGIEVESATSDIGPGTYTLMAQVAADSLAVPLERISVRLGDSDLPKAPIQGGSATAASVGAAVHLACRSLQSKLFEAARGLPRSALGNATPEQVRFEEGSIRVEGDPRRAIAYEDILRARAMPSLEALETAKSKEPRNHARNCHSAVFVEIRVDPELPVVRVTRLVCAVAAGRIINPKAARSQIIGAAVMAIGMALHEQTVTDHRSGRFITRNFVDYHIPAHADVPDIEVIFVNEPDALASPLGAKGVGEIGTVGTAAAIANAIFHATGKRIRDLPLTLEKLL
jgi:xanthine dehydrogenase YagR molybdenum-binding subunit